MKAQSVKNAVEDNFILYFDMLGEMGYVDSKYVNSIIYQCILYDLLEGDWKVYGEQDDVMLLYSIADIVSIPNMCSCI